jgi:hypothetical protein
VLADGRVVGRIMKAAAAPVGASWLWSYGFEPLERQPAHGYAATREAAMVAFAKPWRGNSQTRGARAAVTTQQ